MIVDSVLPCGGFCGGGRTTSTYPKGFRFGRPRFAGRVPLEDARHLLEVLRRRASIGDDERRSDLPCREPDRLGGPAALTGRYAVAADGTPREVRPCATAGNGGGRCGGPRCGRRTLV